MGWPLGQDYQEAVQNPRLAFTDPELQAGQPELDKIGLPRVNSGAFACVFKIHSAGKIWAAKCFTSEIADQQQRYDAISRHLVASKLAHTVPFTFLAGGIRVQGRAYPLVKMQWVQGESLTAFIGKSIGYPDNLLSLAKVWFQLLGDLKAAHIAHGDLQHGNVVVVGDQLRLLDYDGMYVPSLLGKQSNEVGHRNYQLPTRSRWDFGEHLDNFSAWVIYVSLIALAVHPELWGKHRGGDECLIFRQEDFARPTYSALLRDLRASPNSELRLLVDMFVGLFGLSPQDIPALDGNLTKITVSSLAPSPQPGQNWWDDHVERAKQLESNTVDSITNREGPPVIDPGWILDSLGNQQAPAAPLVFREGMGEVRILMAGSFTLVALVSFLVNLPAAQIGILTGCIFGLNLLFCHVRFKRGPSQAEYEIYKSELRGFEKRVQEHQTLMDSLSAERLALQEKLSSAERGIVGEKSRLAANCQASINTARQELDNKMGLLAQRKHDFSVSETTRLNSLQATFGNQISELNNKLNGLARRESDEKSQAEAALLDQHVQSQLNSHTVSLSWIPGIGASFRARLIDAGFITAAQIDHRVGRVYGIGPTRQSALMSWRQGIENDARASAARLSAQSRLSIESKYNLG